DAKAPDAAHALLAAVPTGGNYSGPAVADGHVYLGTGAVIPLAPFFQYHNGITALGLPPKASANLSSDVDALNSALGSVNHLAAAGPVNDGKLEKAIDAGNKALDVVVSDLAATVAVDAPSTKAVQMDLKAYYLAVAAGNAAAPAALTSVK